MITGNFNINERTLRYIIRFLIGVKVSDEVYNSIGYTSDKDSYNQYKIVIIPSLFFHEKIFGTQSNLPILPLKKIDGIPLLYGKPDTIWLGDTLVVYADLIASSFYLLSRYEEYVRKDVRDEHGRFPGKKSIQYNCGFINRPVVDEYGKLLRKWLREAGFSIPEPEPQIRRIFLTHDLDIPFFCRSIRSFFREALKGSGLMNALKMYRGNEKEDPFYTFPWLDEQAEELRDEVGDDRCISILFVKAGGCSSYDMPKYKVFHDSIRRIMAERLYHNVTIGLHSSYSAGINPGMIAGEKAQLEQAVGFPIQCNRHHFLGSREPGDMEALEEAGFTDDFTMGYADVSGFRLGTCRPVKRIDPATGRLGKLKLHPLLIMDCTLSDNKYMNLSYEESFKICKDLIDKVREAGGELVLLWHNNSVTEQPELTHTVPWMRPLYSNLIDYLKQYAESNRRGVFKKNLYSL